MEKKTWALMGLCASLNLISTSLAAEGNRYDRSRLYHSEVTASEAYRITQQNQGRANRDGSLMAVLLDVRSIPEYVAGHPAGALNVPYPRIHPDVDTTLSAEEKATLLVEAVQAAVPNRDTPILVLCKTGSRSISASNLLAEAGYAHVRNIWEGFEGRLKSDVNGNPLDLNNDGTIGDGGDLDGWKNAAGLPYSTKLLPKSIYQPYSYFYYQ